MTRWQHFLSAIRFPKSEIVVVVRRERMSDADLDVALKSLPATSPFYKAVVQLIEQTREEALANIPECATSPAMDAVAMAVHSGGAKYLRAVLQDIILRRMGRKKSRM